MIDRFMVQRKGVTQWLEPSQMTEPELIKAFERAERRRRGGIYDPKDELLERELMKRSTQAPEVGLC